MIKRGISHSPESRAEANSGRDPLAADSLAAAIRKPVDALNAAAKEAADGMLGGAKLGLLVAANEIIDALNAVDAEFARQYGASIRERRDVTHAVPDGPDESINVLTRSRFGPSMWAFASAIGGLCAGIAVLCRIQ